MQQLPYLQENIGYLDIEYLPDSFSKEYSLIEEIHATILHLCARKPNAFVPDDIVTLMPSGEFKETLYARYQASWIQGEQGTLSLVDKFITILPKCKRGYLVFPANEFHSIFWFWVAGMPTMLLIPLGSYAVCANLLLNTGNYASSDNGYLTSSNDGTLLKDVILNQGYIPESILPMLPELELMFLELLHQYTIPDNGKKCHADRNVFATLYNSAMLTYYKDAIIVPHFLKWAHSLGVRFSDKLYFAKNTLLTSDPQSEELRDIASKDLENWDLATTSFRYLGLGTKKLGAPDT